MNAVAYIWRGLINCFFLFVILYVFDNIQDKNTSIIIAVLALLYTTMRTIAGGQALTVLAMGKALHEEFADLKVKIGHEPVPISDDDAAALTKAKVKIWIDLVALSITSLVALLVLFPKLQHW
ncbi:MAG: hypothetical protein WBZ22_26605 [Pseudolabrys sp.]